MRKYIILFFILVTQGFSQIDSTVDTSIVQKRFHNLELYPNPFDQASRIWYSSRSLSDVAFQFADSSNQKVFISFIKYDVPPGTHFILFDEKSILPTGWYTYTITLHYK